MRATGAQITLLTKTVLLSMMHWVANQQHVVSPITTAKAGELPVRGATASNIYKGFTTEREPMALLEELYDVFKLLKSRTEDSIALLKANVETKISDVEKQLLANTETHTNLVDRLHTLEANREERQNRITTVETRLSAIEECIGDNYLAEVRRFIDQHDVEQANLENKLHDLGEHLTRTSAHRVAHEDGMASVKDALTSQIVGIEDRLDTPSVTNVSEIQNFDFILHRIEARLRGDGPNRAQLDVNPISLHTDINSIELPAHEGAACGVSLRLAANATAETADFKVAGEAMAGSYGSAAAAALKDQNAVLFTEDACTYLEHEPGDAPRDTVNRNFEELAPISHELTSRTCYPIAE